MQVIDITDTHLRYIYLTLLLPYTCCSNIYLYDSNDSDRLYFKIEIWNTPNVKDCALNYGLPNISDVKTLFDIKFKPFQDNFDTFAKKFAEKLASEEVLRELSQINETFILDIPKCILISSYLNDIDGDKVIYNEEDANKRLKLWEELT